MKIQSFLGGLESNDERFRMPGHIVFYGIFHDKPGRRAGIQGARFSHSVAKFFVYYIPPVEIVTKRIETMRTPLENIILL